MEVCIHCVKQQKENIQKEIQEEIQAFLENPENFYIRYNPVTGFYKFERDDKK